MSWMDKVNAFGRANAGAFSIMSGVGGAAGVVGFFMDLKFRADVSESLEEIKQYLGRIERNTVLIIEQNKEILQKLDQLPTRLEMNVMLRQAVSEGFLNQAYASLHAAENDVQELWGATSPNWISFRNALQFAFDHDNVISSTAELAAHCSFAVRITEGRAEEFVRTALQERTHKLLQIRNRLQRMTVEALTQLERDFLGASDYIATHNLGDDTEDLAAITFTVKPPRYDRIEGECLEIDPITGYCHEPGVEIRRIDRAFLAARNAHKLKTESHIAGTDDLNTEYGEVAMLVGELNHIVTTLAPKTNKSKEKTEHSKGETMPEATNPEALKLHTEEPIYNEGAPRHKVRIEYTALFRIGTRLLLNFEAASMDKRCSLGGSRSAWLQVALTDENGAELGAYEQAAIAAVSEPGGYQSHNNIDITSRFSQAHVEVAKGFKIRVPGGVDC